MSKKKAAGDVLGRILEEFLIAKNQYEATCNKDYFDCRTLKSSAYLTEH